ncbi:Uma2 family endonuclease [Pseudonocardia sp.]|uniref:Uma2 family endonuclease n=1 Tax=Pseudonocardia sp. TaxID=60912 RepID=UPI002617D4EA|nr:Uma2 family endonuclease [Pseudonocardia sp.]
MTAMTAHVPSTLVTAPRITADEFLSGDHPIGSELVDGVVYEMDPAFDHQEVVSRLLTALREQTDHGRAGIGGNWVLADGHVYKPDVWWKAQRPRGVRHDGPPELAIEVRSPGTWALDVGPKLRQYEAAGTTELWLVDTASSTVLVFRRDDSGPGFADAVEFAAGEELTSPLLPGFALDVDALFADLG